MQAQHGVAEDFVDVAHRQVIVVDAADGGPGRGIDIESGILAKRLDTE